MEVGLLENPSKYKVNTLTALSHELITEGWHCPYIVIEYHTTNRTYRILYGPKSLKKTLYRRVKTPVLQSTLLGPKETEVQSCQ